MKLFICIFFLVLSGVDLLEDATGCFFNDSSSSSISDADLTCQNVTVSNAMLETLNPEDAEVVNLTEVEIDLNKQCLKSLKNLKSMLIYRTKVNVFEPESLVLQKLNVHYSTFPEGTNFDKCCKNLKKLILRNVTGIHLENLIFTKLNRLQQLQLSHIESKKLTRAIFKGLGSLKKLRLSNVNFTSSDADAFVELPNLKELYLEDDDILDIHPEIFKPLKKLQVLTVTARNLKALPLEMFSEQRELREFGLPLRTWRELDVTKIPAMFPKLTSYSYTQEWDRTDRDLYVPLFKKLNDLLLNKY